MFALKPWKRTEAPARWLAEEMETLFNRFLPTWPIAETAEWPFRWALTTEEKEKEIIARVELPGFAPEEVAVELLGNRLTVEAKHGEPAEKEGTKPERAYAHAKRVMTLPPEVELEKAEATFHNGVLEVHFPRKPETIGRRLEVKV